MVTFKEIPATTLVPYTWVEFDATGARPSGGVQPYKLLCVGQKMAAGTRPELEPVLITREAQAITDFGEGSQLHNMVQAVLANSLAAELWCIAIDDAGGSTAAQWTITLAGNATAAGTFFLYVANRRMQVGVASGDGPDDYGQAMADAINALGELPFTAAYATNVVTLTAKNAGTLGNSIDIRFNYLQGEEFPAGVTAPVIANSVAGATDPDITEIWTPLADEHYNVFAVSMNDTATLAALETELASRGNATRAIDAVSILSVRDTQPNLITLAGGRNSPWMTVIGEEDSPSSPWEIAAAAAAHVTVSGSADPALPFQNLRLVGIGSPRTTKRFTLQEREQLLLNGIATIKSDVAGNVLIERLRTTYTQTDLGAPDDTYSDLNTALTQGYFRWDLRNQLLTRFPRHKLADDGVRIPAGQAIVTPSVLRAEVVAIGRGWADRLLLEDFEGFKKSVVVTRDVAADPNRLDVLIAPDFVNQLRVVRALVQIKL